MQLIKVVSRKIRAKLMKYYPAEEHTPSQISDNES